MKKDNVLYTVIFSFIITFIFVFLLALTYQSTKEKVLANGRIAEAKAFLLASGFTGVTNENAEDLFQKNFNLVNDEGLWETKINEERVYLVKFYGNALWGSITGVIAVNQNIGRIIGFEITSHNETPGLGGRIEERWFLDQLKGEKLSRDFKVVKGTGKGDYDSENGYIDGITGATRTSESIEKIVLDEYEKLLNMEVKR